MWDGLSQWVRVLAGLGGAKLGCAGPDWGSDGMGWETGDAVMGSMGCEDELDAMGFYGNWMAIYTNGMSKGRVWMDIYGMGMYGEGG